MKCDKRVGKTKTETFFCAQKAFDQLSKNIGNNLGRDFDGHKGV